MALSPLKQTYKQFIFEPLHLRKFGQIAFAVEDLNISQNFRASYQQHEAYGRMDPIVTYKNTTRSLRVSFSCQAHQLTDTGCGVIDNIKRVNILTQCLYPTYTDGPSAVLKSPPFFRIYYGNYIGGFQASGEIGGNDGLTGYLDGLSHAIGKVARNVALGGEGAAPGRALPRKIDLSFNFTVIHDKPVGWRQRRGRDYFSYGEYGDNFPYNVGKSFDDKDAPRAAKKDKVETTTEAAASTDTPSSADRKADPTAPANKMSDAQAEQMLEEMDKADAEMAIAAGAAGIPFTPFQHHIPVVD